MPFTYKKTHNNPRNNSSKENRQVVEMFFLNRSPSWQNTMNQIHYKRIFLHPRFDDFYILGSAPINGTAIHQRWKTSWRNERQWKALNGPGFFPRKGKSWSLATALQHLLVVDIGFWKGGYVSVWILLLDCRCVSASMACGLVFDAWVWTLNTSEYLKLFRCISCMPLEERSMAYSTFTNKIFGHVQALFAGTILLGEVLWCCNPPVEVLVAAPLPSSPFQTEFWSHGIYWQILSRKVCRFKNMHIYKYII